MKINIDREARKVAVDNRIPLRNYFRIADNLLKQADIYREENNVVDLFIILLRFSSLVSETIPRHRDYQAFFPKEKIFYKKKLLSVVDELESLKPEFDRRVNELEKVSGRPRLPPSDEQGGVSNSLRPSSMIQPYANGNYSLVLDQKQHANSQPQSSWRYHDGRGQVSQSSYSRIENRLSNLSLNVPLPKPETLSRHSILGPSGFQGQWKGPSTDKIHYPRNQDFTPLDSRLNQIEQCDLVAHKDSGPGGVMSMMESVLSLDDGRWPHPADISITPLITEVREDPFPLVKQPSPPPVLAKVQQEYATIPPSKVADPRPGVAKQSLDESESFQRLHIPVKMLDDFLRLARENTNKNLETCGVLAGSLKNRVFYISTLIIPKQESTSDSCQTLNEEEIFEVQDRLSLFPLGWIHTHPSQTCFMSSVDLHTHYSYQIMLPEAIAIVMAPTDASSPYGIFHLSDPGGVSVIRNCQQRGFHPHEEPEDGSPLYEHCSHVLMNPNAKFDVIDLR
ncbi:AMSH-like ubiquitin thioesterase 3 isoform X1 [Cucurbita maxima]|uniref:AMSH-like ubiquitin thioesterase 3 isoform X1 n=1 Tax=Cucurbita maxima TaxID=3661 RepID=A0A6J1L013_CUCMA|nr:AMSH-like ubiquitin thioesterase 3 isoform X1 [Cucurbita maxima]